MTRTTKAAIFFFLGFILSIIFGMATVKAQDESTLEAYIEGEGAVTFDVPEEVLRAFQGVSGFFATDAVAGVSISMSQRKEVPLSMVLKTKAFINAIATETLGFGIGDPFRPEDSSMTCVLPILRETDEARMYKFLPEAKATVKDSGSIDVVVIINNDELPIFIRVGELFKGATQERAATKSIVVPQGFEMQVPVKCVHQSRGIVPGNLMKHHGYAPQKDSMYLVGQTAGGKPVFQGDCWSQTSESCVETSVQARKIFNTSIDIKTDDLTTARDTYAAVAKDILEKVPHVENQIGMCLIDQRGFYSVEVFNVPSAWTAIRKQLIDKEALQITQKDESGVFSFDGDKAKDVLKVVLQRGFEECLISDEGLWKAATLDYSEFVGEVVVLEEEVIHLVIVRK